MIDSKKKEIVQRGTAFFPIQYYWNNTDAPLYNLPVHWHLDYEIIPFDVHASWVLSDIRQRLESKGKRAPLADSMIAATAIANNLILVTRNVKDFENIREVSSLMIEDWSVE